MCSEVDGIGVHKWGSYFFPVPKGLCIHHFLLADTFERKILLSASIYIKYHEQSFDKERVMEAVNIFP